VKNWNTAPIVVAGFDASSEDLPMHNVSRPSAHLDLARYLDDNIL